MEEQGPPRSAEEPPKSPPGPSIGDPLKGNGGPIKGNGGPIKGNGDPIKGNGGPIKGNGGPIKGNGDPIQGNGGPIKGNGDPKGDGDPIKGNGDPIQGNGGPIKGNGAPIQGNGGPIKGNGDPKGDGDPIKGNGDPIQAGRSPLYGNRAPIRGNGDPIKDHETPIQGSGTPPKGNGGPIEHTGTPIQGYGTPIQGNESPIQSYGAPIQGNGDPIKGNGVPIQGYGTPNQGTETPLKGSGTPIKGNGDPIKNNETPIQGYGTPIKGNGDPIKGNETPIKGNETLIQGYGTPIQGSGTPIKGNGDPIKSNEAPIQGCGTPIKGNGTPIKGNGDPIKGNGAPIQGTETPLKGSGTPIKGYGTPIKGNGDPIQGNETPIQGNGTPIEAPGAALAPLRAALEAALLQGPGEPLPPALGPVLSLPLPPPAKCLRLDGARLLRRNLALDPAGGPPLGLSRLHTALSILEKYGRNLLQPRPPRHWRCVSYSNPVFSSTLGAIQGAREVLMLLGYTAEGGPGLSFPPGVLAPHGPGVAAVTVDVLVLRRELELLLANQHPNPHFFTDILKGGDEEDLVTDAMPIVERDGPTGDPPSRCDRPRTPPTSSSPHAPPPAAMGQPHGSMGQEEAGGGWACASCTFLNTGPSVLCGVCERPRLARRPPPQGWSCPHCTYFNPGPGPTCALCRQPLGTPPSLAPPAPEPHLVPSKAPPPPPPKAPDADQWRQRRLDQDGRRVVALLRASELQGSPLPLPPPPPPRALLVLAGAGGLRGAQEPGGPLGALSLAEAARGWACAMGQAGGALRACLGHRRRQLQALASLGFPERIPAGRALFQAGGLLSPALAQLQAPRLQPFLQRLWEPRTPPMDFEQPDQPALVRRALAELGLASWGRAQLFVALGRELGLGRAPRELPELVEAVGSCRDREELRRRLRCECAVCGTALPREQAQVLTGCQCWLCPECFRLHFTVGVRERRVRDLVCPACARPDLRDEACAAAYFSTLDAQLRQCLDPATYELFSQKLTELELERDPQFLWCPQCSFGFIFEAEQGPAECPQCKQCCCPRCQRPWHPAHASLSCAAFEAWLGSGDPQAAAVGLEDFLQEHSIGCPRCGARFALARGGCLHLQCSQCQHQFCSGCACPFHPRHSCPIERCPLRGSLHGHHPRDCIFHLRDWSPPRLQRLLQDASVPFETEPPRGFSPPPGGGCLVLEQKETPTGLKDEPCGREAPKDHAGLCRGHYTEYLVRLINHHGLDPLSLYDSDELRAAAERHLAAGRTQRLAGEGGVAYERRLRGLLQQEAPLCGGGGGVAGRGT